MMKNAFVENVKRKIKTPTKRIKTPNPDKRKNGKKFKSEPEDFNPGVIYIGHIPHGFYEEEMRAYFSQFGRIRRLRVVRSKKTGNPKGYAFIEFNSESVAKIAAEAMNNYLFFEKLLKCEFVPADKVHPSTFEVHEHGVILGSDVNRVKQNQIKDNEALRRSENRRIDRFKKLQSFLAEKDIDFEIESFLP
ncbi:MKI67 FHA domain-interacting nucleolar phosphoprotein-like [Trichonephila inaurata madagascariensis]|uniref:MKI67 FHA domain-interacting nucleolar phosphoprotein-like n=1 Tax=Trichonephila inaurata madagascariensis TaxID=2747483 RepID=A0A8X6XM70_9ARAC|nr:MKI67 FHA domain-interacting nucleolar phosphoprotein-like [Trichonephila inaurata madagascariensis]